MYHLTPALRVPLSLLRRGAGVMVSPTILIIKYRNTTTIFANVFLLEGSTYSRLINCAIASGTAPWAIALSCPLQYSGEVISLIALLKFTPHQFFCVNCCTNNCTVNASNPTATMPNIAAPKAVTPTTKVRTAEAIFTTIGLSE